MRSLREYLGCNETTFQDVLQFSVFAFAGCFISLMAGLTIVLGMLIYYNHVNYMTANGYTQVTRRLGTGLTSKDVQEWVKADQKQENENSKQEGD